MGRLLHLFISILFLTSVSQTGHCQGRQEISIIFASGMAEIQPVNNQYYLAKLATLLKTKRKENDHILFFHGGSVLSPSILSSFDKGAHMVSLLNILRPDIMAIAKSDLAIKEDELTLRAFEATFPFVNSNLYDPLTDGNIEGTLPFLILESGPVTLGIITLIDPDIITDYMPNRAKLIDPATIISKTSMLLRLRGAELIILLTDYRPPLIEQWLKGQMINFAVISDPRHFTPNDKTPNCYSLNTKNNSVCLLTFTVLNKQPILDYRIETVTIPLGPLREDPEIREKIDLEIQQLSNIFRKIIGKTAVALDTRRISVRTKENSFGNFIADTLREFYNADFALINGGSIRGNRQYSPGTTLTNRDIYRELPFNSKIVNLQVTGRQVFQCLENGLSMIRQTKGRFPHVSGMQVSYNLENPPNHRVLKIVAGGKNIDINAKYTLATVDYLADGGDGYTFLKKCPRIVKIGDGKSLREYVLNKIKAQKEISPTVDGRLQYLAN